jgi:hypothetical protein
MMNNADMPAMPALLKCGDAAKSEGGLTKREYFAGLAMQAMLSNEAALIRFNKWGDENLVDPGVLIADAAIQTSDALLAELEKEPSQ